MNYLAARERSCLVHVSPSVVGVLSDRVWSGQDIDGEERSDILKLITTVVDPVECG